MTDWATLVLWCSGQVTVICTLAIAADRVLLRRWTCSPIPFAALLAIPTITLLSLGPLSQWSWLPQPTVGPRLASPGEVATRSSTRVVRAAPPSDSSTKKPERETSSRNDDRPLSSQEKRPSPASTTPQSTESPVDEDADTAKKATLRESSDVAPRHSGRPVSTPAGERVLHSSPVPPLRQTDWPTTLAAAMLVAVVFGAVRLALGVLGLVQLVRSSRVIDDASLGDLVREVAGRLGISTTVSLREAETLSTAATISWPKTILLPTTWRSWSRQELLAVMAHELAHIRQRDFTSWLLAQASVVLHYYHPLVHYLAFRLRLRQEFLADSIAAEAVGDDRAYIRSLAHLALSQPAHPSLLIARSFLPRRRLIVRRIQMLQQRTSQLPLSRFTRRILCVAVVLSAVGMVGLRLPTGTTQDQGPAIPPADSPTAGAPGSEQASPNPAIPVNSKSIEGVWNVGHLIVAAPTTKPPRAIAPPEAMRVVFREGHYYLLSHSTVLDLGGYRIEKTDDGAHQVIVSCPQRVGSVKSWWLPMDANTALVMFKDSRSQVAIDWSIELKRDPDSGALARWYQVIEKHPVSAKRLKRQPLLFETVILSYNFNERKFEDMARGDRELANRLLHRTCAQCHDGDWQSRRLSLAWVPTDAVFVAAVRASKLAEHRLGADFAQRFGLEWPSESQPATPIEIRQATVVSFSWDLFKKPAPTLPTVSALVLHLNKPISPEAAQRSFAPLLGQATTRTVGRYRYWKSTEDGSTRCVWRSSDGRTVIIGLEEPGFLRVLAAGQRGVSDAQWFGGITPPITSYLSPRLFPWQAVAEPNRGGLSEFHDWFGFYRHNYQLPGGVPLDTRLVADLLVYVPFFRLQPDVDMERALAFLTPQQREPAVALASRCTEFVLGTKFGPQRTRAALYFTTKSSQVTDDRRPRFRATGSAPPSGDVQRDSRLGPLFDSLLLSTRLALSKSRDRVSRLNATDVLDQLDRLNAAEEILNAARAYATDETVTVDAAVPTSTLERLLESLRLATVHSTKEPE